MPKRKRRLIPNELHARVGKFASVRLALMAISQKQIRFRPPQIILRIDYTGVDPFLHLHKD
jgi:hypothetical protein